jgi:hypothetical protein
MKLIFVVAGCRHIMLDAVRPDGPMRCPHCEEEPCANTPPGNPPRRWHLLHRAPDTVDVPLPDEGSVASGA